MNQIARSSTLALASGLAALALSLGASAAPLAAQAPDGFLFQQPRGSMGFYFGYTVPGANSEVFDFVSQELTIDPNDFSTITFGGELALRVTNRIDIALGASVSESKNSSEFRDFVDLDDLPIEQVTTLTQIPVTLSAKAYLKDRGQKVGNLAWVPASWAPFVGGGVGLVWYEFTQTGDFVDFETFDIFNDFLKTDGRATAAHGLVGLDYSLSPRLVFTGEGRYSWGKGDMGEDFVNFDALDLSGFRATAGFKLRF